MSENFVSIRGEGTISPGGDVLVSSDAAVIYAVGGSQVCGLKWSPDGSTLASGGNENFLCLWDANMTARGGGSSRPASSSAPYRPRRTLVEHQAAVKALAWCPFQRHLLASGGGTADRSIKVTMLPSSARTN